MTWITETVHDTLLFIDVASYNLHTWIYRIRNAYIIQSCLSYFKHYCPTRSVCV